MAESVITGARGILILGPITLGDLVDVTLAWRQMFEPVAVCGQLKVQEHAIIAREVTTFTARILKRRGSDVASMGMEAHTVVDAINLDEMTGIIHDIAGDGAIYVVERVKLSGRSGGISARAVSYENLEFVAIDVRSEVEINAA